MSASKTEPVTVYFHGLSLFSSRDWCTNKLHNQDERPLEDGLVDHRLEEHLRKDPIGALCFLRGDPEGAYRGCMDGQSLGANIVVAYILAWNATQKENTRKSVFLFITMHWKPLLRQIEEARAPEDINKTGKQDWAQEKWTETQNLFDGLTVNVIKAAAAFFQRVFLGEESFVSDAETSNEISESDCASTVILEEDTEERLLKRKRD